MFSESDPRLLRMLQDLAAAQADIAHTLELLAQRNAVPPPREPTKRPRLPQNKELREWHTFRAFYQRLEAIVRRDNHLSPDDRVTKEMIFAAGGPAPKTTSRNMADPHGLRPDFWPPSTWPVDPPGRPADK
jgi:hypothetical protein